MNFFRRALQTISLLLLFFSSWLMWPSELDSNILNADGVTSVPDYRMRNSRYVSVQEGKKNVEFYSDQSSFDLVQKQMAADKVTIYFYDPEEQKTKVTANKANFDMTKKIFYLDGNVVSLSPEEFEMKSEQAQYSVQQRLLQVLSPVEGTSKEKDIKVWGDRAESSLVTNIVKLYGHSRTEYNDPHKGLTKISSVNAELLRNDSIANYTNDVNIAQKEIVVTGKNASLYFVHKAKNTKQPKQAKQEPADTSHVNNVKYMNVSDDVKILEKDGRYTRSQVAEFFAPTDSIVLTGYPSLYNGDDAVTGDKITLYRTTGVVEVTATNAAAKQDTLMRNNKKGLPSRDTSEDDELIP